MKNELLKTVFDNIFGRLGLRFEPITVAAAKAGTKRAAALSEERRRCVAAIYASTPAPTKVSRQVSRANLRAAAKAVASAIKHNNRKVRAAA